MSGIPFLWPFVALSIVAAAGTAVHGAEPTLRVMTFNLRYATAPDGDNAWDHRQDLLLDTIVKFDPDLLGTQEALASQVDFLGQRMPDYAPLGVGRDDGQRRGEFSAIFFKKSRFELIDSGTFWLSETPDVPGSKSWDSSLPRIATWARLRDRATGKRLTYLNTHWDHRGDRARVESAHIIRHWLAERAGGELLVVSGDLNVSADHAGYRTLVSEDGAPRLVDAYRRVHPEPQPLEATFHGFKGERRGRCIDFILTSPELTALEATINTTQRDGRYPSDHFPVTAVLQPGK